MLRAFLSPTHNFLSGMDGLPFLSSLPFLLSLTCACFNKKRLNLEWMLALCASQVQEAYASFPLCFSPFFQERFPNIVHSPRGQGTLCAISFANEQLRNEVLEKLLNKGTNNPPPLLYHFWKETWLKHLPFIALSLCPFIYSLLL